ncbi:MAG TPA: response regulator transcription factor [Polyangia bacterium]|jgi:DNA-binding response OmpR family regulator
MTAASSPQGRRRVLIIEDEPDLVRGLRDALEFEGFEVVSAGLGREGVKLARERGPDLVLLDLMLPDMNGFSVCEEIRATNPTIPVIMLTARSQESDKIRGLEVGADDYVTKPFSLGELLARINAIFRRLQRVAPREEEIRVGASVIYTRTHEMLRKGKKVALSFYEVELLRLLHERGGQPVTRDEILEKIWGVSSASSTRGVDNVVVKLRKKLEDDAANPRHIVTIYGTGYKLVVT